MTKRSFYLMALITIAIPLRASPPIGAIVQSWHLDPQTNVVTLEIANVTHKNITAYSISMKETYVDGRTDSRELLSEFVAVTNFLEELKGNPEEARIRNELGDGLFHPGQVREEHIPLTSAVKEFHAEVDVVAYADGTAEATNNEGLQRLIGERKVAVASTQVANDIIRAALANPNDADPATTAASEIRNRIIAYKGQRHDTPYLDTGHLKGIVDELTNISRQSGNKRDALNQYLAKSKKRTPHCCSVASCGFEEGPAMTKYEF
jgi:hypothetical protein